MEHIIQNLLQAKTHIGNKVWNRTSASFLLGFRKFPHMQKYAVIDLDKTLIGLQNALHFFDTFLAVKKRNTKPFHLLIVNTSVDTSLQLNFKKIIAHIHPENATEKQPIISYVDDTWVGGTLTNWKAVSKSISIYSKFKNRFHSFLQKHTIHFSIYQKYDKRYKGIENFAHSLPDLILVINPNENAILLREASLCSIPVIAIISSDINKHLLKHIQYSIPGNNKSIKFIYIVLQFFFGVLKKNHAPLQKSAPIA